MKDFKKKLERIYRYLEEHQKEYLLLARRDNFAWLTGGQESGVVLSSEIGFVWLLISRHERIAIAMRSDAAKARNELLHGLGFELRELDWKSPGKEEVIREYFGSEGCIADTVIDGIHYDPDGIYQLHVPMTSSEVAKYRELGLAADEIISAAAREIRPGMTERNVQRIVRRLCADFEVETDVLLIGSDERISKYRHPMATDKKIEKYIMISPVFRKYGLHCNIARLMHFGPVTEEIANAYDFVCRIQAEIIAASREGVRFREIFELQERLYQEACYQDDWLMHMHGAPVGYMLSDGGVLYDEKRRMTKNQAYEWYVTVTGVKSAELVMNIDDQMEILSLAAGKWPVREYNIRGCRSFLPEIMIL